MSLRTKWNGWAVALFLATTATTFVAVAAPPKKPVPKKSEPKKADPTKKKEEPTLPQRESRADAVDPKEAKATTAPPSGGATESKTTEGGARVFRFGELEVEGRLKNPQIVYFLRRVRAEFRAGDLGHRSFLGELSETRKEPSF
mgnify:CR=1 FL=1